MRSVNPGQNDRLFLLHMMFEDVFGEGSTETPVSADTAADNAPEQLSESIDITDEQSASPLSGTEELVSEEPAPEIAEEESEDEPALLEDRLTEIEQEIEESLKNEQVSANAPKWYRENIRKYGKAVAELKDRYQPFSELNTVMEPEQVAEHVSLIRALNEYRPDPATGIPTPAVDAFADKLTALYPHLVGDIVLQLGTRPADASGMNYFQLALKEVGIDPTRIDEIKEYLENGPSQNGYRSDVDLTGISPQYHEVFKSLEPALQEEIQLMSDEAKNSLLSRYNAGYQAEKVQRQSEETRKQQFQQEIRQAAFDKFNGAADSALKAFESTLQKAQFDADPTVNALIAQQNLTTVLTAINPNAWGHEHAKQALSSIGVQVDSARIGTIIDTLEQESQNVVFFQKTGAAAQEKQASLKLARAQQELIAQGQKIAGQILRMRGQSVAQAAARQTAQIDNAQARPVIRGQATPTGNSRDWLENLPPVGTEDRWSAIAKLGG